MSTEPTPTPPTPSLGWLKTLKLALYYTAILVVIIFLHARGGFTAPPFVYQGF